MAESDRRRVEQVKEVKRRFGDFKVTKKRENELWLENKDYHGLASWIRTQNFKSRNGTLTGTWDGRQIKMMLEEIGFVLDGTTTTSTVGPVSTATTTTTAAEDHTATAAPNVRSTFANVKNSETTVGVKLSTSAVALTAPNSSNKTDYEAHHVSTPKQPEASVFENDGNSNDTSSSIPTFSISDAMRIIERLRSEREKAQAERDSARAERDSVRAERDSIRAEAANVHALNERLKTECETARAETAAVHAENKGLKTEWETARAERDIARAERETAQAERDSARVEAARTRKELNGLVLDYDTIMSERDDLRAKLYGRAEEV